MARIKPVPVVGIFFAVAFLQVTSGSVPSIDLLFSSRGGNNQSTTPNPSIGERIGQRIHASLNNVVRLPLPLLGAAVSGNGNSSQLPQIILPHRAVIAAVVQPLHDLRNQQHLLEPGNSQGAPPPPIFLPHVNQAIHSTIAHLSTLSHWPFAYETTVRNSVSEASTVPPQPSTTPQPPPTTPTPPPPPPPTTVATTQLPSPPPPTQALPPPILPPFAFPPPSPAQINFPSIQVPATARPPLPDRIHNRIQSALGNLRLPSLSHIGQPRPRPMLTEPPWVTELLGPTLEPPTTRAPTVGERVHNAVSNVLLFVPATLLNFWYETWGTQHVDRIIQRLHVPPGRPGSPVEPVFATISSPNNPFANFTADHFANPADLPAIAAFINTNGTLMPTIVQPVFNMTANTIEYILRNAENETTVLWTGSLSNDVFFGNKTQHGGADMEDDEAEHNKGLWEINLNSFKKE